MSSQNQNNIYPESCTYGCYTQIYLNTSVNEYWEFFTKKKHICPNRVNNSQPSVTNTSTPGTTVNTKPTYYNKKP